MRRLLLFLTFLSSLAAAQAASPAAPPQKKELTIEAIYAEGGIIGRAPETVKWSPDGAKVSFVQRDDSGEHGALWYVDVATGQKAVLVAEEKLATLSPPDLKLKDEREKERRLRYSVAGYHWAPGSRHLLFDSQGQLWLFTLASGTALPLTSSPDPSGDPKFSPDGSRIAYVRKHNLFVRNISGGNVERQLTRDSDENLLNGEVDWVYAEELDVRSNYFWSPDGRQIAFLQMNEKPVPTYPITDWIPIHPALDMQKYPKVGDANPVVRVGVVDASGGKVRWISVPDATDAYIPRFGWIDKAVLYVQVLNREQNKLDLYFVQASSGHSRLVLSETSDAWVNVNDDFRVLKSGGRFLWSSWRDGYTHLYLYSFDKSNPLAADAKLERQLTHGNFETFGVDGVDEQSGAVYFTTNPGDDRQRQLYRVQFDGSGFEKLSRQEGSHQATFDENGKNYVDNFSAIMTPPSLSVCSPSTAGSCRIFWQARSLEAYNLLAPSFADFKAEDGTLLHAVFLLPRIPADLGTLGKFLTFPVISNPYGGPASQLVRNSWGVISLFDQIMARRGFAIFKVDNRGTPARGKRFIAATRHQYGAIELRDQLAALQQFLAAHPELDAQRIGVWGWSGGGSMTLYSMTHSEAFRAGVAVAPVTDPRDYDSIYTERYLGLLKQNPEGYRNANIVESAANLQGHVLLVHGTGDDNVHMQNSVQMMNALIAAGKQFDVQLYPRKTHGIAGSAARTHLFHRIQNHFERELLPTPGATQPAGGTN